MHEITSISQEKLCFIFCYCNQIIVTNLNASGTLCVYLRYKKKEISEIDQTSNYMMLISYNNY